MGSAQQQNRELEEARRAAESLATRTETQLVSERREREDEGREREERVWELTRQLQTLKELQAQTQAKVSSVIVEGDRHGRSMNHNSLGRISLCYSCTASTVGGGGGGEPFSADRGRGSRGEGEAVVFRAHTADL